MSISSTPDVDAGSWSAGPSAAAPRCPDCGAALSGSAACAACGLSLTGPAAARLWEVDLQLARTDARRRALLVERQDLLAVLHAVPRLPPSTPALVLPEFGVSPAGRPEWTPRRVQNLLLLLGGALLALAAAVFTAVTYDRLGVGGRAAVLLVLTAAACVSAPRLQRRGLGATAETVGAVALALAALDLRGLRLIGLGAGLDTVAWSATAAAVLAGASAAYALAVPLRLPRAAPVVLADVAAALAIARLDAGATGSALLLLAVAAVHVAGATALRARDGGPAHDVRRAVVVAGVVVTSAAAVATAVAVGVDGAGAAVAVAAAGALAAAAAVTSVAHLRALLGGAATALLCGSAVVAVSEHLDAWSAPLAVAVTALVAVLGTAALPARERTGPLTGALAVAGAGAGAVAEPVLTGLAGPLVWVTQPWSLGGGTGARAALAPHDAWTGSGVVPLVLVVTAIACAAAGLLAGGVVRRRAGLAAAAALVASAVALVPVAVDLPHPAAILVLLVLAVVLVAVGGALPEHGSRTEALGVVAAGGWAAVLAAAWSLADQGTTLVVLPAVALLLAVVAARPRLELLAGPAAGVAALLVGAEVVAGATAGGVALPRTGLLLVCVPAVLAAAATPRLGVARRTGLEAAASVLALAAVPLTVADPTALSLVLAACGLVALVAALRPDRRPLAVVGALMLSASSWVRLAEAHVMAPEPYAVPVAVVALVLGHLRFRSDPAARSQLAYGPGLSLLLGPSLVAALAGDGLARPLLLGLTALVVLLVGARLRLQAPLVLGAGTLAVIALDLLAPYAAAVPRWTALAAAGTVLVVVGATFEQRRREVIALRARVAALR